MIVHNHYGDFAVGGEAMVMHAEAELLRSHGHDVEVYERCNSEIEERGVIGKFQAFSNIGWSREGYDAVSREIKRFKPKLMHVHNYKYLLSPSIFGAASDLGVTAVLTLHNYRLACPAGQFLRNGRICEDCLDGSPYRMIWRRCASSNMIKNLAQFYLYWSTRKRELLVPWVDAYIALTGFGKSKFVAAGLPQERVHVKPNFIDDPIHSVTSHEEPCGAIFVGRLSREKGVDVLVDAWREIDYPLKIIGDGPLMASLRRKAAPAISFEGALPHEEVLEHVAKSSFFVFPSVWYEGFGLTLLEAMALGKPLLATDLGFRREMVREGFNGFLYSPYDTRALQEKAHRLINDRDLCETMGRHARESYLTHYTSERNYQILMDIYKFAIDMPVLKKQAF